MIQSWSLFGVRSSFAGFAAILFLLLLSTSVSVQARQANEADLIGATLTADEVGMFMDRLEKKPANVAVFEVRVNPPLDPSFGEIMEGEITRVLRDNKTITVINCFECRAPRIEVREDRLVVKRGTPDQQSLAQLGKQLGVDSFLTVQVFRTRFSLVSEVTLFQASDGTILGTTQTKIPALDWSDAGLQVLVGVGPGILNGGVEYDNSTYNLGGHVALYEEVGFGKAGLVMGGAGGTRGNLAYAIPSIAWRGRFPSSGIYSLSAIGAGFGLSDNVGGIAARASYTVFLGSFTMLGLDAVYMASVSSVKDQRPVTGAATAFIGFSFGR